MHLTETNSSMCFYARNCNSNCFHFQSYNITGLKPFTMYVIGLRIFNGNSVGKGPEAQQLIMTEEGGKTYNETILYRVKGLEGEEREGGLEGKEKCRFIGYDGTEDF